MRFAAILLFSILLASVYSVAIKSKLNQTQIKQIESLKNNKHSWSKIVLNLAELHMMSEGSLDELIQVLQDLIEDLVQKQSSNEDSYQQASISHNEAVSRLTAEVASANSDIASTTSLLNDVLYPKKQSLESSIAGQESDIIDSQAYLERIVNEREESHNNWQSRVEDHNQAISAIEEAQQILGQLLNSESISMIQVKSSQAALVKVEKKLSKRIDATLAKALVELATKEYANQDTVRKVSQMLDQIKGNIVASLSSESENEQREQNTYLENIALTKEHISNVENSLVVNKSDLANTINSISENEAFLSLRRDDLARSSTDLENEQLHYLNLTSIYKEVGAQLNQELAAAEEALNIIENGNFATYISDRLNNVEGSQSSHFQAY